MLLCLSTMLVEAVTAVNRTVILRLEGHLGLLAAVSAGDLEHLALLTAITAATALVTAVTATCWFILESLLSVEFLLTCSEREFLPTLFAYQSLVFKSHTIIPLPKKK